jgi:hypothetical protein
VLNRPVLQRPSAARKNQKLSREYHAAYLREQSFLADFLVHLKAPNPPQVKTAPHLPSIGKKAF